MRLSVLLFPFLIPVSAAADRPLAVVGVRVFTGDSSLTVLENATVVLRNGSIAEVGPSDQVQPPPDAELLEGRGRTLLPGLIDLHVHLGGSGTRFDRPLQGNAILRAEQTLACGVTSVLDLNAPESFILGLRDAQRQGALTGVPRIFSAGAAITAPGGHGTELGFPCRILSDPSQAAREIQGLAALNPDVVKLMYDHGGWADLPGMPSLDRAGLSALIGAVHEYDLLAVVHVAEREHAKDALRAGADALAHYPLQGGVDEELVQLLVESGAALIPTLAVFEASFAVAGDPAFLSGPLVERFVDPRVVTLFREEQWRAQWRDSARAQYFEKLYPEVLEGVARLHRRGVRLLLGTDAGNPGAFHGVSGHRELAALVRAGITPLQALAMATRDAAGFLGLSDQLGQIRPGCLADVVLVDGNPMQRIEETRNLVAVIRAGVRVDRDVVASATRALAASSPVRLLPDGSQQPRARAMFDFEDRRGKLPPHQLVSDRNTGGASLAEARCILDYAEGNDTCFLRITGEVVFRPPSGGFAGVALPPADAPSDFSAYSGIRFRARSDQGRNFRIMLRTSNVRDFDYFGASYRVEESWRAYRIPFDQLRQIGFGKRLRLDVSAVTEVEFVTDTGTEGAFRLDIDDVQLFR